MSVKVAAPPARRSAETPAYSRESTSNNYSRTLMRGTARRRDFTSTWKRNSHGIDRGPLGRPSWFERGPWDFDEISGIRAWSGRGKIRRSG